MRYTGPSRHHISTVRTVQVEEVFEFQHEFSAPEVTVVQQQLPELLPDRVGFIGAGQVLNPALLCCEAHGLCNTCACKLSLLRARIPQAFESG